MAVSQCLGLTLDAGRVFPAPFAVQMQQSQNQGLEENRAERQTSGMHWRPSLSFSRTRSLPPPFHSRATTAERATGQSWVV